MKFKADDLTVDVRDNEEEVAAVAALMMVAQLLRKPRSVLALAWGSSPTLAYEEFNAHHMRGSFDASQLIATKLDECVGAPIGEEYMREHIIEPLGLPPERYVGFKSDSFDSEAECQRVFTRMSHLLGGSGSMDLMVLGIGENGHLGFNEDAYEEDSGPHVHKLAHSTVSKRGFPKGVTHAYTYGIKDIMDSKQVLVIACGTHKRSQVEYLIREKFTPEFTATILRKMPQATLLCDRKAAKSILSK